jgi:glyoxylase-like metal-dependent hydrolase (beta-lactamase superfamily II)
MHIESFFDKATFTWSHVVHSGPGTACAIIDSVLDYEPRAGRVSTAGAQRMVDYIGATGLRTEWILETHAHADHLSAGAWLREKLGGRTGIGDRITIVQNAFRGIYNLGHDFSADGSQFDHLFAPDERFSIGALDAHAMYLPGHTPADIAYVIGDAVFVGDTLFPPDAGTARCDFPGGDARQLYQSVRRLLALPPETRLYMCHDYPPPGREPRPYSTVAEQRAANIHVRDGISEETFVDMRSHRDATLEMPVLILPSVQVNINAGRLPPPEANGIRYLRIPIDAF